MASNLQLRIAHLEPQTLALWVLSPHSNREFCVLGIVVHLRLEHYRVPDTYGHTSSPGSIPTRTATKAPWTSFPRRRVHSKAAACKPPSSRLVAANPTSRPASSMFLGDGVRSILHASMVDEDQCPGAQYTVHRIHSRKMMAQLWGLNRLNLPERGASIVMQGEVIGSTPVLKIALPSSPLPEHRSDRRPSYASRTLRYGVMAPLLG